MLCSHVVCEGLLLLLLLIGYNYKKIINRPLAFDCVHILLFPVFIYFKFEVGVDLADAIIAIS